MTPTAEMEDVATEVEEPFVDASRIFAGHRALGLVSNHIPLVTRYIQRRKESLIVTVIGNSFQTYGSNKLGLLSVGTAHEDDITCLAADAYHVYTASGCVVRAWRRGTELKHEYRGHQRPVHLMLPFGPHLLAVDEANQLKVWDVKAEEATLELDFNAATFHISTVVHPVTYLNKVLFGSQQGQLELWNLKSSKQVYVFAGWQSAVTLLEQAPAVDVVAIGLASGDVVLHNLRFDTTIVKFRQDWGPVTALTFRTDGAPIMITGSSQGHLAVWDLEQQVLVHQHRRAHKGAVTGLKSLPSEPLIVTSSPDNTLKMWIFDGSDGGMRLLHLKDGHKAPPIRLRFHDELGEWVLSSGLDSSLRAFSTVADLLNRNLGTAHHNQNKARRLGQQATQHDVMPPICEFASEPIRDKEWDSIAAVHRGRAAVTTWSFHRSTMGQHRLVHERFRTDLQLQKASATCVTVSACGNFAIVGYDSGHVDRFNLQSGLHRAAYALPEGAATPLARAVRGVASDGLNQRVVAAVQSRRLVFWKFHTAELAVETPLDAAPAFVRVHRQGGLLAVALEDLSVAVVELETGRVVRRLAGHDGRLTDVAFSPDARWLVSSSQDGAIRTWDLPTGSCVDHFRLTKACTSLTFAPNGAFLATSHVDDLGVYLWNNKSLFAQVSLRAIADDHRAQVAPLPGTALPARPTAAAAGSQPSDTDGDDADEFTSPEQIADSLVTLSLLPESRWKNLLDLDTIKRRNKPKEAPKAPQAAPFFLQNLNGAAAAASSGGVERPALQQGQADDDAPTSRLLEPSTVEFAMPLTPWADQLLRADTDDAYREVMESLKRMGPSAIDGELRSLCPHLGGSVALLRQFLLCAQAALEKRRDYELVHAYLGLFLKIHCETIGEHAELCQLAGGVRRVLDDGWSTLQTEFESALCLVGFFINAVL